MSPLNNNPKPPLLIKVLFDGWLKEIVSTVMTMGPRSKHFVIILLSLAAPLGLWNQGSKFSFSFIQQMEILTYPQEKTNGDFTLFLTIWPLNSERINVGADLLIIRLEIFFSQWSTILFFDPIRTGFIEKLKSTNFHVQLTH